MFLAYNCNYDEEKKITEDRGFISVLRILIDLALRVRTRSVNTWSRSRSDPELNLISLMLIPNFSKMPFYPRYFSIYETYKYALGDKMKR